MSYCKAILTELLKKTPKIGSGQTFFGMKKKTEFKLMSVLGAWFMEATC